MKDQNKWGVIIYLLVIIFFTVFVPSFQEYMVYRKHTYMRLDGSSKISERRDMVADFQSRWVKIKYDLECKWLCMHEIRRHPYIEIYMGVFSPRSLVCIST